MEVELGYFCYIATVVDVKESEAGTEVYFIYDSERLKRCLKRVKYEVAAGSTEYKMLGTVRKDDKVMACLQEDNRISYVKHKCYLVRMFNLLRTKF